jgi:hypothetical protein
MKILMALCETDLRCLDAHAHLGNLVFDYWPELAIRHYQVGVSIGELSLEKEFDGLLPWGYIDNRPFLRCLQSFGLCLWRVGEFEQAEGIFRRMLWLNPSDNQSIRFMVRRPIICRNSDGLAIGFDILPVQSFCASRQAASSSFSHRKDTDNCRAFRPRPSALFRRDLFCRKDCA